ncbi:MAG: hypothetical protein LW835_09075 [Burkholderiaceae bacterium]|nr:hypothetical protein [Burkholderiaceae bacterium]
MFVSTEAMTRSNIHHKDRMNINSSVKLALTAAVLLAFAPVQAQTIGKVDYNAAKTRISADFKSDKASCDSRSGNAKDICVEEAKAKEKVALADLEYKHTGKSVDRNKLLTVKAETAYAVAKERCDDKSGNAKDVCVQEAKAVEVKALADAKMGKEIGEARSDAAATKRDADYKVAVEKCDAMSGDAKASCITAAKASFGKS